MSHGQFDVGVNDTESALLLSECLLENSEEKNQNGANGIIGNWRPERGVGGD